MLSGVPEPMRKVFTYEQGKEMSEHNRLTDMTDIAVFFADQHHSWPREHQRTPARVMSNGADLSSYTQGDLNAFAWKLNHRPRKNHGFRTPLQGYNDSLLHY